MEADEGGFRVIFQGLLIKSPERQGFLHKWQQRHFVLRKGKRLEYWDDATQNELKGCIDLKKCFGISDSDDKYLKKGFPFSVHLPNRKYVLVAETMEDRTNWVRALKIVCDMNKKKVNDAVEATKRTETITSANFRGSSSVSSTKSGHFFDEDDEPLEDADDDEDVLGDLPTIRSSRRGKFVAQESFREPLDSETTRDMEGTMFTNPLMALRAKATKEENQTVFDATYTKNKSNIGVVIKIMKPQVFIQYKESGEDLFVWKLDEIDTYSQNKSILTISTNDGKEYLFVVLTDGSVADALATAQASVAKRHASLSAYISK